MCDSSDHAKRNRKHSEGASMRVRLSPARPAARAACGPRLQDLAVPSARVMHAPRQQQWWVAHAADPSSARRGWVPLGHRQLPSPSARQRAFHSGCSAPSPWDPLRSGDQPLPPGFQVSEEFVAAHAALPPPFGFNGLGEMVYKRTYARPLSSAVSQVRGGRGRSRCIGLWRVRWQIRGSV